MVRVTLSSFCMKTEGVGLGTAADSLLEGALMYSER